MATGRLGKAPPPVDPLLMQRFGDLVRDRWGFHYSEEKQGELLRAIQQGCMHHHCKTAAEYYQLLTTDNDAGARACDQLTDTLTIGETYFFRNQPQFEDLRQHVLPELIERRRGSTRHLHIWSAGSATGEEPYSLAIMLRELIPDIDHWNIELLATDVNSRFLDQARRGIYRGWSFREDGMEDMTRRYFTPLGEGKFQVIEPAREMVKFQVHNLVSDPFPVNVDLIVCRNVLIYFSTRTSYPIIDRFYDALTPGGYLLLGHTESSPYVSKRFPGVLSFNTLVYRKAPSYKPLATPPPPAKEPAPRRAIPGYADKELKASRLVASRLAAGQRPLTTPSQPAASAPLVATRSAPGSSRSLADAEALDQAGDKAGARRIVVELAENPGATSAVWTFYGKLLADEGNFDEALVKLKRAVGLDACDVEANYLLSLIYRESGDLTQATKLLKQTIYLVDDKMALAQFDLGNIQADLGDQKKAQRHWQLAAEILAREPEVTPLEIKHGVSKGWLLVQLQQRMK